MDVSRIIYTNGVGTCRENIRRLVSPPATGLVLRWMARALLSAHISPF